MSIEELKENIIKECTGYYDLGGLKKILTKPEVLETSEMCIADKKLNYQGGVALGPFVQYQLFVLFFIVFPVAYLVNYSIQKDKFGTPFIVILVLLYAIGFLIFKNIKSLHREIKIDRYGVTLSEGEFQWTDIYKTFILTAKGYNGLGGSTTTTFLIIVDKSGIIIKHEITFLSCPNDLLATIIEYYKNANSKN